MTIAVMDITSLRAEICAKALSSCRPVLASHFEKAKNADLFRSRVGAYLLAVTLYRETVSEDAPDFSFSPDGRPAFAGNGQPELSLSHDGNFVAAVIGGVSDNIGIDLQAEPAEKTATRILSRFPTAFSDDPRIKAIPCSFEPVFYFVQQNGLCEKIPLPSCVPSPAFSLLWTRAEAIRKLRSEKERQFGILPEDLSIAVSQSLSFRSNEKIYTLTVVTAE